MLGVYYLHINGDLIWKDKSCFHNTTILDYFDYPDNKLVVKWWVIPEKKPDDPQAFVEAFIKEAITLSKNKGTTIARVKEIMRSMGVELKVDLEEKEMVNG